MLTVFFAAGPVRDYDSAVQADAKLYGRFFHAMLDQGIYLAPSQFEAAFLSAAHDDAVLAKTAEAVRTAVKTLG
jgi:glutamate-1-semialdehyde 2,1-aminomutase